MTTTFIEKSETQPFEWIDVYEPTETELNKIAEQYGLHHYTVRDCLEMGHLPKFEQINHYHFLIVRTFDCPANTRPDTVQDMTSKIAIFYGEHFLVTIHRKKQYFIDDIKNKYVETATKRSPEQLIVKILRQTLHTYEQPALKLADEIDDYERLVFLKSSIPSFQKKIYYIKHQISISKRILGLTSDVISRVYANQPSNPYVQDLKDQYLKIVTIYEQSHDDINNLLNIYLSLSAQKTNDVMKIIAIFSVFFMPATFLVGVYGMNFENMPELKWKYGYYMVWVGVVVISLTILQWFKRKNWL